MGNAHATQAIPIFALSQCAPYAEQYQYAIYARNIAHRTIC